MKVANLGESGELMHVIVRGKGKIVMGMFSNQKLFNMNTQCHLKK